MNDASHGQLDDCSPARDSLKNLLSTEGFLAAQRRPKHDMHANDFASPRSTHRQVAQSMSQAKWNNMKIKKYDSSGGWGQLTGGKPDVTSSRGFFKPAKESSALYYSTNSNFDERVESVLRVYPEHSMEKKVQQILHSPE